jgi:4'-phosphopantetheinyl transferase
VTDRAVADPTGFAPDADWPTWPSASLVDRAAIHVLRLWLPDWLDWAQTQREILSDEERGRADRFYFEPVRQRFVACRVVLRHCLARCLNRDPVEIVFEYGPHGKPQLSAAQNRDRLSFNVAHSADVALIAIGWNCELGADVEAISSPASWRSIAQRFFAPSEWTQLQELPEALQPAGFYRAWTGKEAYMKATGRGMSLPLGRFAVCVDPRLPPRLIEVCDDASETARWHVRAPNPTGGYAAAVMWDGPATAITQWTWSV